MTPKNFSRKVLSLRNLLEFKRSFTNSKGLKKPISSVTIHGGLDKNPNFTNNKIFILSVGIIHLVRLQIFPKN